MTNKTIKKENLKNWDTFVKGNISYFCSNREEANALRKLCITEEITIKDLRINGGSATYISTSITLSIISNAIPLTDDIIPSPEFTLSDLKTGMIVRLRNGSYKTIMRDTPIGDLLIPHNSKHGFYILSGFRKDLTNMTLEAFDIMKVYTCKYPPYIPADIINEDNCIYSREDEESAALEEEYDTLVNLISSFVDDITNVTALSNFLDELEESYETL
ncbi:MAG: hypothetical protein KH031_09830 [Clostridiales bacterium]|nr:hypothetical protein [Clostridiales bacterium]